MQKLIDMFFQEMLPTDDTDFKFEYKYIEDDKYLNIIIEDNKMVQDYILDKCYDGDLINQNFFVHIERSNNGKYFKMEIYSPSFEKHYRKKLRENNIKKIIE